MRVLWAVDHALQSASRTMAERLGVTGPQRLVIRIVGRYPGIAPGALAAILHVHPSTLTGVLRRLERRGLLERAPDPRDRRRVHLRLSARGARLDTTRTGTVEAAVRQALGGLPSIRVAIAAAVLRSLAAGMPARAARRGGGVINATPPGMRPGV
jgi:DNA-binding MarR family transcriptional regulator